MTIPNNSSQIRCAQTLNLAQDGAELCRGVVDVVTRNAILAATANIGADGAGTRLYGVHELDPVLAYDGAVGAIAASVHGPATQPVRALLFDKTAVANWALGWHQDRTIAVAARIDVPGFGPWTTKKGATHVAPPFEILADMVTLRVHLDDVSTDNAPLLVAPGSHRFGRIPESDIAEIVARCGMAMCEAAAGDVWIYATPILHASKASSAPNHRRVLQIDYARRDLPGGLAWLGV